MENINTKRIEEEIRQYKLYKIQIVDAKRSEYEKTFNEIKQNIVIKFTKNASSNLLRFFLLLVTVSVLLVGVLFLFPEHIIKILEENGEYFSKQEKIDLELVLHYLGYVFISISILIGSISSLLKKNIKKRNTIYDLSKLISEVIDYMGDNVKEDKKKYEYFVDNLAEIEKIKNDNTTQHSV